MTVQSTVTCIRQKIKDFSPLLLCEIWQFKSIRICNRYRNKREGGGNYSLRPLPMKFESSKSLWLVPDREIKGGGDFTPLLLCETWQLNHILTRIIKKRNKQKKTPPPFGWVSYGGHFPPLPFPWLRPWFKPFYCYLEVCVYHVSKPHSNVYMWCPKSAFYVLGRVRSKDTFWCTGWHNEQKT